MSLGSDNCSVGSKLLKIFLQLKELSIISASLLSVFAFDISKKLKNFVKDLRCVGLYGIIL